MNSPVSYTTDAQPTSGRFDSVVSWSAFALLVATASGFAWYVPRHMAAMKSLYKDFGVKLPASAQLFFDLPPGGIVAVSVVAVVGAAVAQILARSKRSATLVHLLLIAVFVVTFLVYRESVGDPLTSVMQGISGPPRSGP